MRAHQTRRWPDYYACLTVRKPPKPPKRQSTGARLQTSRGRGGHRATPVQVSKWQQNGLLSERLSVLNTCCRCREPRLTLTHSSFCRRPPSRENEKALFIKTTRLDGCQSHGGTHHWQRMKSHRTKRTITTQDKISFHSLLCDGFRLLIVIIVLVNLNMLTWTRQPP